jgi:Sec-independent protein secretion pathway component TatC
MFTLRSVLLNWNLNRVTRAAVSGAAVFLAIRVTDGFLMGLGVAVVLAMVLDIPWWLYDRSAQSDE